ncbi:WD repeat-containing protein 54 [Aphanomyces cochlioides]|nr:WD repeat-containing protein 54 [Aphanomyces cochlioides]
MWETKPEVVDAELSASLLANNLSVNKDTMVFAHLEDVVVVNPKSSGKKCNRITLVEKSIVYQTLVCELGGEVYLAIATESGCQIWDVLGEHLHYSLSLAKELATIQDLQAHFCRGLCHDDKSIFVGSSASTIFTLTLEAGQSKGQSEFAVHSTSAASIHAEPIHALSTPQDQAKATLLCSGDDEGTFVVWSIENAPHMEVKHKIRATGYPATTLKCISSDWCLSGDTTGKLRLINLRGGYVAADVGAHSRNLSALDANDNRVVTVGEDGYLNVWKLSEKSSEDQLKISLLHSHRVGDELLTGVVLTPSQTILTMSYDVSHIKVWKCQ